MSVWLQSWSLILAFQLGSAAKLLQHRHLRQQFGHQFTGQVASKHHAPDLWAETAMDHVPGMTQELELTRTAGDGWYTVNLRLGGNVSKVIVDTASPWLWSYGGSGETSSEGDAESEKFSISYLSAELGGDVLKESLALHADSGLATGKCKAGKATNGDSFWLQQYKTSGVQGVFGLSCGTADSGAGASAAAGLQTGLACAAAALDAEGGNSGGGASSIFSLQLNKQGGTLSFGEPPFDLLRGLVAMPPAMHCGNWRAPLRVSMAAKGATDVKDFGFSEAVLDSAAPGIIGMSERVASLAGALGAKIDVRDGQMVFVMPCSRAGDLPIVDMYLGQGREAHVRLSGEELLIPDDADSSGKQCRLIFRGWDSPQWLLGMPFFRAVRGVVFNPFTQVVSIAP